MAVEPLAIGCAAGFGGDRTDSAGPVVDTLVSRGGKAVLVFEMLAERTLALAQLERRTNPDRGYAPLTERMVRPVLRRCLDHGIPIVSNFGAANPVAAAQLVRRIACEEGASVRVAVVEGDDLSSDFGRELLRARLTSPLGVDSHVKESDTGHDLFSASAYIGAPVIADALRTGAQVVITGRVADPSLAVGPAMAHFGWAETDWDKLGRATIAGHLIECGAQVTGGYFADPGFKDVPDLHAVGFPIVEVAADGSFVVGKANGTGGVVDRRSVTEQLLYEVHDPAAYLTPDVVADISEADVEQVGLDRVAVRGVRGHERPDTLKVIAYFAGGWLGEGEISYAGPNAESRARLAMEVVRRRVGDELSLRFDLIGVLSVFGDDAGRALGRRPPSAGCDVRLRVAAAHPERARVEAVLREVTALYTCGPAGGGGVRTTITRRLRSTSCLVPRELVPVKYRFVEE